MLHSSSPFDYRFTFVLIENQDTELATAQDKGASASNTSNPLQYEILCYSTDMNCCGFKKLGKSTSFSPTWITLTCLRSFFVANFPYQKSTMQRRMEVIAWNSVNACPFGLLKNNPRRFSTRALLLIGYSLLN